eukprot:Protomagalhaensia_sp_Gyna_25__946@NODE_1456_length_1819_cov_310_862921_g1178_i0_p1_GENE_NODE_1456_length_1819_cov_310_862921_g1178_i0NODE_1456_length_1819_cov_310_862921_g1178_i0_p1_ORF_typecomplete_len425_score66_35Ran_BP1/PF00638_18/5_5e09_NODE_1456_length_1819_cov_310_862921_g1178_i03341608
MSRKRRADTPIDTLYKACENLPREQVNAKPELESIATKDVAPRQADQASKQDSGAVVKVATGMNAADSLATAMEEQKPRAVKSLESIPVEPISESQAAPINRSRSEDEQGTDPSIAKDIQDATPKSAEKNTTLPEEKPNEPDTKSVKEESKTETSQTDLSDMKPSERIESRPDSDVKPSEVSKSTANSEGKPVDSKPAESDLGSTESGLTAAILADSKRFEAVSKLPESTASVFSLSAFTAAPPVVKTPFGAPNPEVVSAEPEQKEDLNGDGLDAQFSNQEENSPTSKSGRPQSFPGEEEETVLHSDYTAVLLKLHKTEQEGKPAKYVFQRVGTGVIRVLKDNDGLVRLVFRQAGTWRILMNSPSSALGSLQTADSAAFFAVSFVAMDSDATPPTLAAYRIKFAECSRRDRLYKMLCELTPRRC